MDGHRFCKTARAISIIHIYPDSSSHTPLQHFTSNLKPWDFLETLGCYFRKKNYNLGGVFLVDMFCVLYVDYFPFLHENSGHFIMIQFDSGICFFSKCVAISYDLQLFVARVLNHQQ